MNVKGIIPCSFVDWPGKICSVVFMGGCKWACHYCHNKVLAWNPDALQSLNEAAVVEALTPQKGKASWLDGVTITGGEPTDDPETLFHLIHIIHTQWFGTKSGTHIKLDTNGSNPDVLARCLGSIRTTFPGTTVSFVQAVYMDIKTVLKPDAYTRLAGRNVNLSKVLASVLLLHEASKNGIEVVFRTTMLDPDQTGEDVIQSIEDITGPSPGWKWVKQPYVPRPQS